MAQAIFKSWFVDFEPWGGVMPEDWTTGSLLDIADYLNGLAMQRFRPTEDEVGLPVLKIKELRQGSCDSSSELCSANVGSDYVVHDGDVIFSWSGSLLVDFWCGGDCGLNQHLFKVTSSKYDKWFYYAWTKHYLARFVALAADKATTMGHIKRGALGDAEVLIPSHGDYLAIGNLLSPIYECLIANRIENARLAALRDTLLPRLMSGELFVADVDGRMVSAPTGDIGGRMVSTPTDGAALDGRQDADPTGEETPDGRMVSAPTGESGIVGADIIRPQTDVAAK